MSRRAKLRATPADELARAMTRQRCAHMTATELRLARRFGGVRPGDIDGPPVGVIIGESPGPSTGHSRPLLPWPVNSSGERLVAYGGITIGQYLGRFFRRNLFTTHVPDHAWSAEDARASAKCHREWMLSVGSLRAVLLGARVAAAFGFDGAWQRSEEFVMDATGESGTHVEMVTIPHPSGLNRVYNERAAVVMAGAALRWAGELDRE